MQGILIVAHGSRRESTKDTMETIADLTRQQLAGLDVALVTAYMEFCSPNVAEGLEMLRDRGVDEISLVPYFLFDGMHIQQDIPDEIAAFCAKNPDISVSMGKTLGEDPRLADILVLRVGESLGL